MPSRDHFRPETGFRPHRSDTLLAQALSPRPSECAPYYKLIVVERLAQKLTKDSLLQKTREEDSRMVDFLSEQYAASGAGIGLKSKLNECEAQMCYLLTERFGMQLYRNTPNQAYSQGLPASYGTAQS